MKDELAERLLTQIMDWEPHDLQQVGQDLQALARVKYDGYDGYRPGQKFLEALARWLSQFEPAERHRALDFVLRSLVFISRSEMDHLVSLVYPDFLRPRIVASVARQLDLPAWRVARVADSKEFRASVRRTLILGMADGARLDKLRRSSPELSHEQFYLVADLPRHIVPRIRAKLKDALVKQQLPGPEQFERVVLVDDFAGSGYTLIREESDGALDGRLPRWRGHLEHLVESGALTPEPEVVVVLYVASIKAAAHVRGVLQAHDLDWELVVVQLLTHVVDDSSMLDLCTKYYDEDFTDQHKGSAVHGFKGCALPLVLSHNTPNNSISLLWADSGSGEEGVRALFPRYERHHADRP